MPLFGSKRAAAAFSTFAAASALLAAGCAKTSPAVGTWTATTPMPASLTLAADGTGTFSLPSMPKLQNKPVTWKAGENKAIELSMGGAAGGSASAPGAGGPSMPATLSEDGKSMTLQFPMASIQLTKSEGK